MVKKGYLECHSSNLREKDRIYLWFSTSLKRIQPYFIVGLLQRMCVNPEKKNPLSSKSNLLQASHFSPPRLMGEARIKPHPPLGPIAFLNNVTRLLGMGICSDKYSHGRSLR